MEEKKTGREHQIWWKDRARGSVKGVTDVLSFDESSIYLETEQGMLVIKGKELHIGRLTLEQGEVEIEGRVDSIVYTGSTPHKKGAVFKRLFQ